MTTALKWAYVLIYRTQLGAYPKGQFEGSGANVLRSSS